MTTLCCNDTSANHCKYFFYATLTCSNDFWKSGAEFLLLANGRCHLGSRNTSSCLVALYMIMVIPTAISLVVSERGIIRAKKEPNVIVIR